MKDQEDFRKRKRLRPSMGRLSKDALDRLVEEAIVDCYNEPEQATGLYTMIEENRLCARIRKKSQFSGFLNEAERLPRQAGL